MPVPIAERLASQLLSGPPATSVDAVVERLLAVQAQDANGARLAVRARSDGLSAADVNSALNDRLVVITWVNRGTLHLVRSEDYAWLHALTTPQLATGNARRLEQEGVSPAQADRGVVAVERALAEDGPLTRAALRERLDAAGVPTAGQALIHILLLATIRGLIVRGPMVDGDHAFVLVRDWLGARAAAPVDRDAALAELARRYLAGHAPADARDLARWAGIGLRDARAGLKAIGPDLVERKDGLLSLARGSAGDAAEPTTEAGRSAAGGPAADAAPSLPGPRLLGPFEPLLLGWCSRDHIIGPHRGLVTTNGIFKAFALVDGRAVATWRLPGGRVQVEPLRKLTRAETDALAEDARDVERFIGARE